MSKDIRGDLYYIDPKGETWKITQKASAQNGIQWYWHADRMRGEQAHRVSASMHRLLVGIDRMVRENGHDGDKENGQECLHPGHPKACEYPTTNAEGIVDGVTSIHRGN